MKILFVNQYCCECGGVEYYINALAKRLKAEGHGTALIYEEGACIPGAFDKYYDIKGIWQDETVLCRNSIRDIDRVLLEFSPEVVFLHNVENGRAIDHFNRRINTVRYVHCYKTVDPDGKMLLQSPLEANPYPLSPACFLRAYTRRAMPRNPIKAVRAFIRAQKALEATKRVGAVIVASRAMKETLELNGVTGDKIRILPYFVDYPVNTNIPDAKCDNILFAGRIAEGKGLELLLEVLAGIGKSFILNIAGAGPLEGVCRRMVGASGIGNNVIFGGWQGHEKMDEFYSKCAFIVVPSVWPEPFGICGIEAAFFARPAIAFNVGGISDWLIDGETGFLVEPYNKMDLAERITRMLEDVEETKSMGITARERVLGKYMPEEHISKLLSIFSEGHTGEQVDTL